MDLRDSITTIKGIGPKKSERLGKFGISTAADLLTHFPRGYQDRRAVTPLSKLVNGIPALTYGKVAMVVKEFSRYKKKQILRILVEDSLPHGEIITIEVVFFHANFLEGQFQKDKNYYFYGTPKVEWGKRQMIFPEFYGETSGESGGGLRGIIPLYPLTYGLSQVEVRKWIRTTLDAVEEIPEYLPQWILEENRMCNLGFALNNIHFPTSKEDLGAAKYRLIFDELYLMELGLMILSHKNKATQSGQILVGDDSKLLANFPFTLTNAQKRVQREINFDIGSGKRMNRLIQGDVGSGKTILAAMTLYKAAVCGYQGVLMAPTELLASQHQKSLCSLFEGLTTKEGLPITVGLLTGGMKASSKKELLFELKTGRVQIVVGTHALLEPDVQFHRLGLVVTDEQHRFGVEQRMILNEKGNLPHILVMTATPIPRTLAVVLYGDMDISVLDEKPANRKEIITKVADTTKRKEVYQFVAQELEKGKQVFVVTPLIEESDSLDVKSAEEVYDQLKKEYSNYHIGCLHGDMPKAKKNEIMKDFAAGKIHLLVSTVVIEVGIDIPNASVMVVENAERFGLAQLHQLRGRVGRGIDQSYCILISGGKSTYAKERAEIMASSNDGFLIAEKDLQLRGPGEFFGTRQHGLPTLQLADLTRHIKVLEVAKQMAAQTLSQDWELSNAPELRRKANVLFERGINL